MRKQKGQALVEFALILPLLLMLLFGVFEFGRAMFIKNTLNNAARAAVRVAVVTPNLNDNSYNAGDLSTRSTTDNVQAKIYDSLFSIDKSTATASIVIARKSPTTYAQSNDTVTITVICNFESIVSKITNTLQINMPNKLQGQASMRYE